MKFFKVVSIEEGREIVIKNFRDYKIDTENIDILNVLDRILAEDIVSDICVPEFDRSSVDGYAIKSRDSHGASETIPSMLNLIGEVKMGEDSKAEVNFGDAVYVPTGGMIPKGADSVVMIEHVERLDDSNIMVYKPVSSGENVIFKGDDTKNGDVVLEKGKKLNPQDIGALASLGKSKVKVYNKLKFYIISTGDEIVDIDEKIEKGKIRDINSYALYSLIKKIGGEVVEKKIVKDNFDMLKEEVQKGLDTSDIVIMSGGSSVGTRDFTHDVINSFEGKGVLVHGISIKPGKPTIVGDANGKIIFGLPGHPVSSIVVFKAFVEPIIKKLMNIKDQVNKTRAIIDFNFRSSPGKTTYQMVSLEERDGKLYATPRFGKSGMITLLSSSNGYIVIHSDEEGVYKGEEREVYLL
ncbi:molybdenum cofactor biosynthesis protein MoeA [Gottschalkia purinilytica]|uniref:Molybdopterin molybdenumtransferase n=1 Tax=Gottschalkia purinilytica TaxID=1503 RepID=A0A0L0W7I4_GOTPU|nr:gephyrin-like molybdotransferase Glp [Gottschalkia purinilytica]KNF07270.1 molybdenum cofactor biosynthesis protein MoeA [Gottschalkia purinilytica]